jgi:hypothetical protein
MRTVIFLSLIINSFTLEFDGLIIFIDCDLGFIGGDFWDDL